MNSLLSLGDMLTFVGLIVAALQFLKPRYMLIWRLSNNFLKSIAVAFLVVGYFLPLASILIPHTNDAVWDSLSLSQILQVAGFVTITVGLLIIVYIYTPLNRSHLVVTMPKFKFSFSKYPKKNWRSIHFQLDRNKIITTHSAKKFHNITSRFLIRGNIEEVVEIIHYNLPALVRSAVQYVPRRFSVDPNTETAKPNGSNYAFEVLLQLLTDEAVMKHICTNNYPFLHNLVILEKDNDIYGNSELANVLYDNLLEHLVLNQNSLLYTQKDVNSGTARFANVYSLLTDDKIIRRYNIVPGMLTYHISKTDIPLDKYVDVLLRLLEGMIKSYKKQPDSGELLTNIRMIFDQLIGDSGVTRKLAYDKEAREKYSNDIVKSMAYKVLSRIELALTTGLLFKTDDPDAFKKSDTELQSENEQGTYDQKTLTGLMAHKVYELIEDLNVFYRDTDDPDGNLLREAYSYISIHVDTPVARRYRELLWERLFDKAIDGKFEKYSTNIEGYYPNLFRFIVSYLIPRSHLDEADAPAKDRLKGIMANELKDALLAGKKMHDENSTLMQVALLPSNVKAVVSKKNKTVKYYHVNSKGKRTLIDLSVKAEAVSVLEVAKYDH